MRIHHAGAIRVGDCVVGSSGDFGPAFLAALNVHTGKVLCRERGFSKSTLVYADGKTMILDEDGNLTLAIVSAVGLNVISKCKIAERYTWATPTLVDTTPYVRDREHIMAFDLK